MLERILLNCVFSGLTICLLVRLPSHQKVASHADVLSGLVRVPAPRTSAETNSPFRSSTADQLGAVSQLWVNSCLILKLLPETGWSCVPNVW